MIIALEFVGLLGPELRLPNQFAFHSHVGGEIVVWDLSLPFCEGGIEVLGAPFAPVLSLLSPSYLSFLVSILSGTKLEGTRTAA